MVAHVLVRLHWLAVGAAMPCYALLCCAVLGGDAVCPAGNFGQNDSCKSCPKGVCGVGVDSPLSAASLERGARGAHGPALAVVMHNSMLGLVTVLMTDTVTPSPKTLINAGSYCTGGIYGGNNVPAKVPCGTNLTTLGYRTTSQAGCGECTQSIQMASSSSSSSRALGGRGQAP